MVYWCRYLATAEQTRPNTTAKLKYVELSGTCSIYWQNMSAYFKHSLSQNLISIKLQWVKALFVCPIFYHPA